MMPVAAPLLAIIAEDEESGRMLLEASLSQLGLDTLAFANGGEALAAALANEPRIVLLDVDMPGLNGFDVCRRLRELPRFAMTPIVMVTNHDEPEAITRAFQSGATDFIAKPVNWALLPRRLEYILRNAANADRIERLAFYDTLTGLPNRQRCLDEAQRMRSEADLAGEGVSVICLDLLGLKRVNDSFGHQVGDQVLQAFASRLLATLQRLHLPADACVAGRFGGDEFAIVVRGADVRELASGIAATCLEDFRSPLERGSLQYFAAPAIGMSVYPEDGADVAALFKCADAAMYHARVRGSGAVVAYSAELGNRMRDWLEIEGRLRHAVQNELLTVVYQPKFRVSDRRLVGAEALLRWRDGTFGDISAMRFIEIAENSGLILEMGAWVLRTVCRQLRQWLDRGIALPVAINCSGKELLHGDPAGLVEAETRAAGIPASLIEVELTESVLINDSGTVQDTLKRLRALGCRIALDDFGTGYSSLSYLTRFPPDRIKIDKSFIQDIDRSESSAAVARAILALARGLKLTVTAEGVERDGQMDWLRANGCDEVQGYLFSAPVPATELEKILAGQFSV